MGHGIGWAALGQVFGLGRAIGLGTFEMLQQTLRYVTYRSRL